MIKDYILFFCQASGDIVYILAEIDKLQKQNTNKIMVLCCNDDLYRCFETIELNGVDIVNFKRKHPPISRPWQVVRYRKFVQKEAEKLDEKVEGNKIAYFMSIYDDAATPLYLLNLMRLGYSIKYLNHYDDKQHIMPIEKLSFFYKVKLLMFWFCTGIHYEYYNMAGRWDVTRFPKEEYEMEEMHPELNPEILKKYSYQLPPCNKEMVLFFSQPNRETKLIKDDEYNKLHHDVLDALENNGYYVVLKGHPNHGICPGNSNQGDLILPEKLPSELVDMSKFSFAIGFMTIGLGSTAKLGIPTYSFLKMMKDRSSKEFELAVDFSNSTSENKIRYVSSIDNMISKMNKKV